MGTGTIWWAKKKFKLRKDIAREKARALSMLGSLFKSLWSFRGAVSAALIIVVINVVQLFLTITGKLVVLPFDVHTDQTLPTDFGSDFAESLAARLNDYRRLFPPLNAQNLVKIDRNDNSFDVIQSFLADLPLVDIPRLSPLNKGSTALASFKVASISIPIGQIIFENLASFHKDTVRGVVEAYGDQITARLSIAQGEDMSISVPKSHGYRKLIDRICVELLERKNWIAPVPMKPEALQLFAEGLEYYRNYTKFGEESFLTLARQRYQAALDVDRNADLVRLHLATTQYISWDDDVLRSAVSNFSALRGSLEFKRQARIGHVAAELRLMVVSRVFRTFDRAERLRYWLKR